MDSDHFDLLSKGLATAASRRSVLGALVTLWVGGLKPWSASAKHTHKHHKKHHHKPEPFCKGANYCVNPSAVCDPTGAECSCFVTGETGEPFCGTGGRYADCSECTPAETCIELSGEFCGEGTGCAVPCPNPL
jgi:hypothetical protein